MTARTPLEQALTAYTRHRTDDRRAQVHVDDAITLAQTGIFSIRNIIAITGLPENFANDLIEKHDKVGGRLNPETLTLMQDLWMERAQRLPIDRTKVSTVLNLGTSQSMLSKLTGIPQQTISAWRKHAADAGEGAVV